MPKICMGCMAHYEDGFNICPHCGYIEDAKAEDALHMEPGSILRERYIVGKVLGFGGFGTTYLGWDAMLEHKVAIKEYLPSEFSTRVPGQTKITILGGNRAEQFYDGLSKFVEEARNLAKLHQESGIVRIFDSFEANNTAYIIMEYLQGETLAQKLNREKIISPDRAIALLMPLISALETVHAQGIIHRDIAPDNIFITDDGHVKLIDFGAARFATTSHSRSLTVIIKAGFSPEEQYRSRGDQGSYTDVYAVGATLYRIVTGINPPDAFERRAHFENTGKDIIKPPSKFVKNITDNQETAILNALNVRIEDRTQNMAALAKELTTEAPETIKRLHGKIRKSPIYGWPAWAKIGVSSAMFAIIALSSLFMLGVIGFDAQLQTAIAIGDGMSRVPSVVNDSVAQAESRLNEAALLYSIVGRDYSDQVPANFVLTQNINAGTVVIINTIIEITISGGIETEIEPDTVPALQFQTIEEATQILLELGLFTNIEYAQSETVAEGLVISQHPEAGTAISESKTVTMIVSSGAPSFAMPNVVGMTEAEARSKLIEHQLAAVIEYEDNSDAPEGSVINQNIAPNTQVNRGDIVTIVVSSNDDATQVPNDEEAEQASAQAAQNDSQTPRTAEATPVPETLNAGEVRVGTVQQLRDALAGNAHTIILTNNITLTQVSTRISEVTDRNARVRISRSVTIKGNYSINMPAASGDIYFTGQWDILVDPQAHLIWDGPTFNEMICVNGSIELRSGRIGRIYLSGDMGVMNGGSAGSVEVANEGIFTLNNGTITAGIALGWGEFIMNGGNVSDSEATESGAVFLYREGRFTMNGGTISGGRTGVRMGYRSPDRDSSEGEFLMKGGTITGNTVGIDIGQRYSGTIELMGGSISGNGTDIVNNSSRNITLPTASPNLNITITLFDWNGSNFFTRTEEITNAGDIAFLNAARENAVKKSDNTTLEAVRMNAVEDVNNIPLLNEVVIDFKDGYVLIIELNFK